MEKTLFTLLLLGCCCSVHAQTEDQAIKGRSGSWKKTVAQAKASPARPGEAAPAVPSGGVSPAQARKAARAEAQKQDAIKPAETDPEESGVMIDSKADPEDSGRSSTWASGPEQEEAAAPGGIPSSYGQCKGIMSEGGRTVLVFESAEDGAVSLVQLLPGKKPSWRLVERIPRSME